MHPRISFSGNRLRVPHRRKGRAQVWSGPLLFRRSCWSSVKLFCSWSTAAPQGGYRRDAHRYCPLPSAARILRIPCWGMLAEPDLLDAILAYSPSLQIPASRRQQWPCNLSLAAPRLLGGLTFPTPRSPAGLFLRGRIRVSLSFCGGRGGMLVLVVAAQLVFWQPPKVPARSAPGYQLRGASAYSRGLSCRW